MYMYINITSPKYIWICIDGIQNIMLYTFYSRTFRKHNSRKDTKCGGHHRGQIYFSMFQKEMNNLILKFKTSLSYVSNY